MKSFQITLLLAIGMMVSNVSWAQNNLPDANLPSHAWRNEATGKIDPCAAAAAAQLMNLSGETINATPQMGLQSLSEAANNSVVTVTGRVSGLSENGNCEISFSQKTKTVSAHFWFRWDKSWVLYIRAGCWNPVLVYTPMTERGVPLPDSAVSIPQIFVFVIVVPIIMPADTTQQKECETCCPADSSYATNAIGPLLKYTYNNGFKAGLIYQTSNRFLDKADQKLPYWRQKFLQWDGTLSLTAGFIEKEKSVTCDSCLDLTQVDKEIGLEIEPGFKLRLGNEGALLHPYIGGAIPMKWSKSHEWDIVPLAEAGIIMGLKNGFPKNKGLHLTVSGTYSKYGFGSRFGLMYFFGLKNKSKEQPKTKPAPPPADSNTLYIGPGVNHNLTNFKG